jgi:hypothetical protein
VCAKVVEVLAHASRAVFKSRTKDTDFNDLLAFVVAATPVRALTFPAAANVSNDIGHTNTFTAAADTSDDCNLHNKKKKRKIVDGRLFPHGITSNGQFLFVLTSPTEIRIFALASGGLLSPQCYTLPKEIGNLKPHASLVASPTTLYIYCSREQWALPIRHLLAPTEVPLGDAKAATLRDKYLFYAGDGVTFCTITKDLKMIQYSFNNMSDPCCQVLLVKGKHLTSIGPGHEMELMDIKYVPVEMCGSFVSLFYGTDESPIQRTFSLLTGQCLRDEGNVHVLARIAAICYDSRNRCHWVVKSTDATRMTIVRMASTGCINPSLIGFVHYPLKKNNEVDMISRINTELMDYVGSLVFPEWVYDEDGQLFFHLAEIFSSFLKETDRQFKTVHKVKAWFLSMAQIFANLVRIRLIECDGQDRRITGWFWSLLQQMMNSK